LNKDRTPNHNASSGRDQIPHSRLWIFLVLSYIGPLMGWLLSAYLSGYYSFLFYLFPVIAGAAALILIAEAHTPVRRMQSKGYSTSAIILSVINIIAYPLLLLLLYNFFYKDPLA
jgi:hypothetical protein